MSFIQLVDPFKNRMFTYCWYETTNPNECKFGEKWVKAGENAEEMIWKRIRDSLGVRKDLINSGIVVLKSYWDVTEYAIKVNRYYQRSRVDDHIRPHIGFRKGSTGEIHELPAVEVEIKVNKLLAKIGQPLPSVGLAAWQARTAENVIDAIDSGNNTIIAELCARFGKTIWSGVLAVEMARPLTIIASYVLTSFTSFEKDLTSFDQFKDLVIIDLADPEYQDVINTALANNKQVVAFLSMCNSPNRQKKIDYLFGLNCDRLLVIDEADFGSHTNNQAKPLVNAVKPNDATVLMTGTNADKAVSYWPIDYMVTVVYPELIMEKKNPKTNYTTKLKYFDIDPSRHQLVVDVEFYQMDLIRAVELARVAEPDLFVENGICLPGWTKTATNPIKAKGFITRMLQSVFEGKHGLDELNVDYQTNRRAKSGQRVAMMFIPASITNASLGEFADIAQQALAGYKVVPIYGDEDGVTNRTAEPVAKEEIQKAAKLGQHVLLISAKMAQRSFSVGEITELYLAYDSGDNGATVQKISRALTPDEIGKIGKIISLSFDPNRDDKFDALLIETACNYKNSSDLNSTKDSLKEVLKTVDIFRCTEDGAVKILADTYLEKAIERRSIDRVCGKITNISMLSAAEVKALISGNKNVYQAAKVAAAQKGKTGLNSNNRYSSGIPNSDRVTADMIKNVKLMIATIVGNLDIIIYGTNNHVLKDALDQVAANGSMRQAVEEEFGLDFDIIYDLFDRGVINKDLVELKMEYLN